jgi:acyl-CoA thioesterase I
VSSRRLAVGTALLALALLPAAAQAQTRYIAFGDSLTEGVGDDPARALKGYPPRLESLLNSRGQSATVQNAGLSGETTVQGLARLPGVISRANPGDVLLLMEGTNDINERVSNETSIFNLDQMAARGENRGMRVVHATVPPRLPSANFDGDNQITASFAAAVRDLAWSRQRSLVDPFEVFFFQTPNVFSLDYLGGSDKLHPNAAGYDLLARVFADVLTNVDSVPPVTGQVLPDRPDNVPATALIRVDLYDFGAGIDVANTQLLLNDQAVTATATPSGRKLTLSFQPTTPLRGVVSVGVHSRDLASPPHTLDRILTRLTIAGTIFLDGDIDQNGRVDGIDLVDLALHFGTRRGDPRYLSRADLNGDGLIDGTDLAMLAANFGRSSF